MLNLEGKRVLVTGGSGFIGSRLVEHLVRQHGATVRVPVRQYAKAARAARFPVELLRLDLLDDTAVDAAVEGCTAVIHCAYGNDGDEEKMRRVTVDGTRAILDAARRHGVQRVVHVSTINVYGETPDGPLDETARRRYFGDVYSDSKLDAENLAMEYAASGDPVTVVQPTVVYGPFALAWTVRILNEMTSGRIPLINGGDGLCNAVYIDDLVDGMLRAATRPEAIGECFLLSGGEPVPWHEFYGRYEGMLGRSATVPMSAAEAIADYEERFVKKKRRSVVREAMSILRHEQRVRQRVLSSIEGRVFCRAARMVLPSGVRRSIQRQVAKQNGAVPAPAAVATATAVEPEAPIHAMSPSAVRYQASKTHVSIDKARRLLDYEPAFDLDQGMQRTEQWARWAGLLS